MTINIPCWTTSKEEADKLLDNLSEVCFEYGKDESNPKMLNVFYATKALKNYVGIMQGRIELLTARIAELEAVVDKLIWSVEGRVEFIYSKHQREFEDIVAEYKEREE